MIPILLDSSAWIEFLADGSLAESVATYLKKSANFLVPTIVLYEVYKKLKNIKGEDIALEAAAHMARGQMVPLADHLALLAADLSIELKLPMADAIVLATARSFGAQVITLDEDFRGVLGAVVLKR